MVTAIDTSVLLDVLMDDPTHAEASFAALEQARYPSAETSKPKS